MKLEIELPREGDGCNPNTARCLHRFRQAADAKHARTVARLYTQQAMQQYGFVKGEFHPRYAVLVTWWNGHDVDVDNAAACLKAYQDGVFDALGCNDRGLLALLSVKAHANCKQMHKTKRLILLDFQEAAAAEMAYWLETATALADDLKPKKKKGDSHE